MRILLIEDEEKLVRALANNLKAEGFAVDIALTGLTAWNWPPVAPMT